MIIHSRRLFLQFIVDAYSMIESLRLLYVKQNQSSIRKVFLAEIEEVVKCGDVNPSSIGSRVVFSSLIVGAYPYMLNNSQDAMAICRRLGYPDLFLTVNYLQSKIARDIKIYQQNVKLFSMF